MKVVIALGANLEDPRKQVSIAIDKVRDIVKVENVSFSMLEWFGAIYFR